jgi:cation-transporting ATPase E
LLIVGLWILNLFARPITPARAGLVGASVAAFAVIMAVPGLREWFRLDFPKEEITIAAVVIAAVASIVLEVGWQILQWRLPPDARTPRFVLRNPSAVALRGEDH